jgi:hypothetical protein
MVMRFVVKCHDLYGIEVEAESKEAAIAEYELVRGLVPGLNPVTADRLEEVPPEVAMEEPIWVHDPKHIPMPADPVEPKVVEPPVAEVEKVVPEITVV